MSDQRFAIVVARFYEDLADRLIAGAMETFEADGVQVDVYDVPGAYELPMAAKMAAETGRYAGIAALGVVIRGETSHYDHVCDACAIGLQFVQIRTGVPCAFGVLTVENMDQAWARADGSKRDQGVHAAQAVLAMARLNSQLS